MVFMYKKNKALNRYYHFCYLKIFAINGKQNSTCWVFSFILQNFFLRNIFEWTYLYLCFSTVSFFFFLVYMLNSDQCTKGVLKQLR